MLINEIEVTELASLLDDAEQPVEIIDIREAQELASGTVPNARHIPMATLPSRLHELPRDKQVIMVCRSGARSGHACAWLMQQGFANVVNLRGGMMAWHSCGLNLQSA